MGIWHGGSGWPRYRWTRTRAIFGGGCGTETWRMVGTTNFGRYYGRLLTPGLTNGSILKANLRAHRVFIGQHLGRIISENRRRINRVRPILLSTKSGLYKLDSYVWFEDNSVRHIFFFFALPRFNDKNNFWITFFSWLVILMVIRDYPISEGARKKMI